MRYFHYSISTHKYFVTKIINKKWKYTFKNNPKSIDKMLQESIKWNKWRMSTQEIDYYEKMANKLKYTN